MTETIVKLPGTDLASHQTAATVRYNVANAISAGNRVVISLPEIKSVSFKVFVFATRKVEDGADTEFRVLGIDHALSLVKSSNASRQMAASVRRPSIDRNRTSPSLSRIRSRRNVPGSRLRLAGLGCPAAGKRHHGATALKGLLLRPSAPCRPRTTRRRYAFRGAQRTFVQLFIGYAQLAQNG